MYQLITIALLASLASSLVIPRTSQPASYDSAILEPYETYHTRYLALKCEDKHDTSFFSTCCHPLLKTEKLSSRPAECTPSGEESSDDDDDCGDDTSTEDSPTSTHTTAASEKTASTESQSKTSESDSSDFNTGGIATFFYQNGNAGACGQVHSDSALICAMDQARYGNSGNASPLCGKQVEIINENNGRSLTVIVADDCPTCDNENSIDLSVAAFSSLSDGNMGEGTFPIKWKFLD
jgi:rare lipoprotein A (peptidoglycan hydrolase)